MARGRIVRAVHAKRKAKPDPEFEVGLSAFLRTHYSAVALVELYGRFSSGEGPLDEMLRRAVWRAVAHRFGHGVSIGIGVGFKHLETFEIGDGVFIGAQAYLQGRVDGICRIGDRTWIGPQSYFDARDLVVGADVGWGPGAKVLGSEHLGAPTHVPIISTGLEIRPVRIEDGADIGTAAIVLPGVTIGRGSIVGAGSVVVSNVAPFSVVAGVPARLLRWRRGGKPATRR